MSDKVFQAIAELIAERNDSDPAEVTRNTRFQDVGIDSLDTVEMLMNLEDKIGVEIELSQKVETVGELVDYVVAHAE
ncbi:MAG: acyl carrier protein [Oscillospiraceae bacterium]|nr:MAG: acyl carrier protein [Clostridia bacterium]